MSFEKMVSDRPEDMPQDILQEEQSVPPSEEVKGEIPDSVRTVILTMNFKSKGLDVNIQNPDHLSTPEIIGGICMWVVNNSLSR